MRGFTTQRSNACWFARSVQPVAAVASMYDQIFGVTFRAPASSTSLSEANPTFDRFATTPGTPPAPNTVGGSHAAAVRSGWRCLIPRWKTRWRRSAARF